MVCWREAIDRDGEQSPLNNGLLPDKGSCRSIRWLVCYMVYVTIRMILRPPLSSLMCVDIFSAGCRKDYTDFWCPVTCSLSLHYAWYGYHWLASIYAVCIESK